LVSEAGIKAAGSREEFAGVALSLSLDKAGEEAFSRLVSGIPSLVAAAKGLASDLGSLAEDLIVIGKSEDSLDELVTAGAVQSSLSQLARDLETVLAQVGDSEVKTRLSMLAEGVRRMVEGEPEGEEEEGDDLSKFDVRVLKAETEEERTVLGVVLEPETVDAQNDIYSEDEIRKTAYRFMERYQQFGLMHKEIVPSVLPLESYLAPVDFELNGQKVKKGTWLVRVRVLDDGIWKRVQSGELTGFSIGGSAIRRPDTVRSAA